MFSWLCKKPKPITSRQQEIERIRNEMRAYEITMVYGLGGRVTFFDHNNLTGKEWDKYQALKEKRAELLIEERLNNVELD